MTPSVQLQIANTIRVLLACVYGLSPLGSVPRISQVQPIEALAPEQATLQQATEVSRLSLSGASLQSDASSQQPRYSDDGAYVTFASGASNLVTGDTNSWSDIFVKNLVTAEVERVSLGSGGTEADGFSDVPSISADGRYVAFRSGASNLVANDGSYEDVFVFDRQTDTTLRVNETDTLGVQPTCNSHRPTLSADGQLVAFWSCADNLLTGVNPTGIGQIYIRDLGITTTTVITPVSVSTSGVLGDGPSEGLALSSNGRYVVFDSQAHNLVAGDTSLPEGLSQIFVRDLETGVTSKVSHAPDGTAPDGGSYAPAISGDGRYITYRSDASNLVADDTNGWSDVFVYDRQNGTTERVSLASDSTQADQPSWGADISPDGRYVSFLTDATTLAGDAEDGTVTLYVHDRQTDTTRRVASAIARSLVPYALPTPTDFSADGAQIAFTSLEASLVAGDTNGQDDVFAIAHQTYAQPDGAALPGSGTGLAGQYFNGSEPTGAPSLARLDPAVDFLWWEESPDPAINTDGFAVAWSGQVISLYSEPTFFYAFSDERIRIYVDNVMVLDHWDPHTPLFDVSTAVTLVADQPTSIRVEYADDNGWAEAHLYWSSASLPLQVVPASQLNPTPLSGIETVTPTLTPTGTLEPGTTETATEVITDTPAPTETPTATPESPTHTPTAVTGFDLAEVNASAWTSGSESTASTTIANDFVRKVAGTSSVSFVTDALLDWWATYPATQDANWDLSGEQSLSFWLAADNTNETGFEDLLEVRLIDAESGGYLAYTATSMDLYAEALQPTGVWVSIPLEGDSAWSRSAVGSVALSDIDAFEIRTDTFGGGFVLWLDDVRVMGGMSPTAIPSATPGSTETETATSTPLATETATGTPTPTEVSSGPAVRLQVLMPGETAAPGTQEGKTGTPLTQVAGEAFEVQVRAVDDSWNTDLGFSGSVTLTTTDPGATLPTSLDLVNGQATVSVTTIRAAHSSNPFLVTASHQGLGSAGGTGISVLSGPAAQIAFATSPVVTSPLQPFTITATISDTYGNPVAGSFYVNGTGRHNFPSTASSDWQVTNLVFYDAGTQSITVTMAGQPSVTSTQSLDLASDVVVVGRGSYQTWGSTLTLPAGTYTYSSLTLTNGAALNLQSNPTAGTGVTFQLGTLNLNAGTALFAERAGFAAGQGSGAGQALGGGAYAGASHGGLGGRATSGTYGDPATPVTLGSYGVSSTYAADGGGAIAIQATGAVTVNGTISAQAYNPLLAYMRPTAGGSGGSVLIDAAEILGSGTVLVSGGAGTQSGGGGGRIALHTASLSSNLSLSAAGGTGTYPGQTGTIQTDEIDYALSSLVVAPTSVMANGSDSAVVTVTLRSGSGSPVAGREVELRVVSGGVLSINGQSQTQAVMGQTDASGVITATLTATSVGARQLAARIGASDLADQETVTFVPGPLSPEYSLISAAGGGIPVADGTTPVTITVVARDAFANPLPDLPVTLTATSGGSLQQPADLTGIGGQTTGWLTSAAPGPVTVSAEVAGVPISQTVTVHFASSDLVVGLVAESRTLDGPSSTATTPGEVITYTVSVTNTGGVAARDVVVTQTLPADVTLIQANPTANGTGPVLSWTLGALAIGEVRSLTVVGLLDETAQTAITSTVVAADSLPDEDSTDNAATAALRVVARRAILTVTPVDPNILIQPGIETPFTFSVRNTGNLTATDLVVSAPATLNFVSVNALPATTVAPGSSVTVTVQLAPPSDLTSGYYHDSLAFSAVGADPVTLALHIRAVTTLRDAALTVLGAYDEPLAVASLTVAKQTANASVTAGVDTPYMVVESRTTDASGQTLFAELEGGVYTYTVAAPGYDTQIGVWTIQAGAGPLTRTVTLAGHPQLDVSAAETTLFVLAGETETREIVLRNTGTATLTGLHVTAPANLPWLTIGAPDPLPDLAPGESTTLLLTAAAPMAAGGSTFMDQIAITADVVAPQSVALTVRLETAPLQDLVFSVADEAELPLATGHVILTAQSTTTTTVNGATTVFQPTYSADIESNGEARFTDIPAGDYTYAIEAAGYDVAAGSVRVKAQSAEAPTQAQSVMMAGLPFTFDWEILTQQGGETDLRLRLNYLTDSPRPEALAFGNWTFSECGPSVITSTLTLVNPTDLVLTLRDLEIDVPGVAVSFIDPVPGQLEPRSAVDLRVSVARIGALGQGEATIRFDYLAAPDGQLTVSVNPLVANVAFVPGDLVERAVTFTGADVPAGQTYALEADQGEQGWAQVGFSAYGPNALGSGSVVTGTVRIQTPQNPEAGAVYTDTIAVRLRGTNGLTVSGNLNLQLQQDLAGDWLLTTSFAWTPPANVVKSRTSTPPLQAALVACNAPAQPAPVVTVEPGGPVTVTWVGGYSSGQPVGIPGAPAPQIGNDHQQVQLVIDQRLLMLGQSTQVNVALANGPNVVQDLEIDALFATTEAPTVSVSGFAVVPIVPTDLGTLAPGERKRQSWMIVPTSALGVTDPGGKTYLLTGIVSYSINGVNYSIHSLPQAITIYPKPNLRITYRLPQPSESSTTFELRADIVNLGPGYARNVQISSSQPRIVGNESGIPIGFSIRETTLAGSSLGPVFNPLVGDIAPGETKSIVWTIFSSVPGRFTQFSVDLVQQSWGGRPLPATISEINTIYTPGTSGAGTIRPVSDQLNRGDCKLNRSESVTTLVGDPVEVLTGNFIHYLNLTGDLPAPCQDFGVQLTYNSATAGAAGQRNDLPVYADIAGHGWTFDYAMRLVLPSQANGETGLVIVRERGGNELRFSVLPDGSFEPYPGISANLAQEGSEYVLTDHGGARYRFDGVGRLQEWEDSLGQRTALDYDAQGQLTGLRALGAAGVTVQSLTFTHNPDGTLNTVTDSAGRTATLSYAQGDLIGATDLNGRTWSFEYEDHRLTRVIDPSDRFVVRNVYDAAGAVQSQYGPDNQLTLSRMITATADGGHLVTVTDARGNIDTYRYDVRNTLVEHTNALQTLERSQTFAATFAVTRTVDARGAEMLHGFDGYNPTVITNALGITSSTSYDSLNHPVVMTDGLGNVTRNVYTGNLLTGRVDALGRTTSYFYTTASDAPQPENLLKEMVDPLGQSTRYLYNARGQVISTTTSLNGSTTLYGYDTVGRLITTTVSAGATDERVSVVAYDAQGNVSQRTERYLAGQPQNDQNTYNLITTYAYDAAGRQLRVTDTLGRSNWTCYDSAGRTYRTVSNASGDGLTPATDPCNVGAYVVSADPAYDRISTTVFDAAGNVIASIGVDGTITRTYFDALNRPYLVVQNLVGVAIDTPAPPAYDSATPDQNVRSETVYDVDGQVLKTISNDGQVLYTCRDILGRVVRTVANPTVADPCGAYTPSGDPDQDVIQEVRYDDSGQAVATIDPLGRITRTYYDAMGRAEVVIRNLVGQAVEVETPPAYNPAFPDRNVGNRTYYDVAGRVYRTQDLTTTRSNWTCFDDQGRVEKSVANATGNPCVAGWTPSLAGDQDIVTTNVFGTQGRQIATIAPDGVVSRTYTDPLTSRVSAEVSNLVGQSSLVTTLPAFDPAHPDQNLVTLYGYDALGRTVTTTVAAGSAQARTTWTCYDVLGRTVKRIVNASVANPCAEYAPSSQNDLDLITRTVYDAAGRAIAQIDAQGRIDRTYYDALGRPSVVVHNLIGQAMNVETPPVFDPASPDQNVRETVHYDAGGRVFERIDNAGSVTRYAFDALGRTIATVQNYVSGAPADDDTNLRTETVFDKAGNGVRTIDPAGGVVAFTFDGLNRNTDVLQNVQVPLAAAADTNVHTGYRYDGRGNRVALVDANGHETLFGYDGLSRQTTITDALGHVATTVYNKVGLKAQETSGANETTLYTYDGQHRLLTIDYPAGTADVTFSYDALGNRLTMTDGTGQTIWQYDVQSRPLTITSAITGTVGYTYDRGGNVLTLRYPGGQVVTTTYDGLGRVSAVQDWANQVASYSYAVTGQVLTTTLPNGVTTAYGYDAAERLRTITHTAASGQVLAAFGYELDALGNRTQAVEQLGTLPQATSAAQPAFSSMGSAALTTDGSRMAITGMSGGVARSWFTRGPATTTVTETTLVSTTVTYAYDGLGRPFEILGSDGHTFGYAYDAVGNVYTRTQTISGQTATATYTYDAADRLTQSTETGNPTVWHYRYDGAGRLIGADPNGNSSSTGARRYSYHPAGYLLAVEEFASAAFQPQAQMVYNGLGGRVQMQAWSSGQSATTQYALDLTSGRVLAASADGLSTRYTFGLGGAALGEQSAAWGFGLADGVGSIRAQTSAAGVLTLTRTYGPWGEVLAQAGTGSFTWGYFGGVMDAATGLIDLGDGRYYDPTTGRFLTPANPTGPNPYVPWGNPLGAMLAPIALGGLVYRRRKGGKVDGLLISTALILALGMSLSACGSNGGVESTPVSITSPSGISTPTPGSPGSGATSGVPRDSYTLPAPGVTVCPEPGSTTVPTGTPEPVGQLRSAFPGVDNDLQNHWNSLVLSEVDQYYDGVDVLQIAKWIKRQIYRESLYDATASSGEFFGMMQLNNLSWQDARKVNPSLPEFGAYVPDPELAAGNASGTPQLFPAWAVPSINIRAGIAYAYWIDANRVAVNLPGGEVPITLAERWRWVTSFYLGGVGRNGMASQLATGQPWSRPLILGLPTEVSQDPTGISDPLSMDTRSQVCIYVPDVIVEGDMWATLGLTTHTGIAETDCR